MQTFKVFMRFCILYLLGRSKSVMYYIQKNPLPQQFHDTWKVTSDLSMVIRSYTPKLSPMLLREHKLNKEKSSSHANVVGESPRGLIPEGGSTGS